MTQAGDMQFQHDSKTGLLNHSQTNQDGNNLSTDYRYNIFAETQSQHSQFNDGTNTHSLYQTDYQRDKLGRITQHG